MRAAPCSGTIARQRRLCRRERGRARDEAHAQHGLPHQFPRRRRGRPARRAAGIPLETAIEVFNAGKRAQLRQRAAISRTTSCHANSTAAREWPTSPRTWRWPRNLPSKPDSQARTARLPRTSWRGRCSRASVSRTSRRYTSTWGRSCLLTLRQENRTARSGWNRVVPHEIAIGRGVVDTLLTDAGSARSSWQRNRRSLQRLAFWRRVLANP